MTEQKRRLEPWEIDTINAAARDMPGVVKDFYQGVSPPSSMLGPSKEEPKSPQAVEVPLRSPPGVALLDRLLDAQDAAERRHRAELAKKLDK
jgi:hypothetical protein